VRAPPAETRNRDHVLSFIAALNGEGKTGAVLEHYSRSQALDLKIASFEASYPGFRIYPLDAFSERDLVVVRYAVDFGTRFAPPAAPLLELLESIAIFRVHDRFITDLWLESDVLSQVIDTDGMEAPDPQPRAEALLGVEQRDGKLRGDTEASRSLVLGYLAALNKQRKTKHNIARFVTDSALAGHVKAFEAGFPGYNLLADEVIAAGDRVAVRFHTRQRHVHDFMGVPATGLEVTITGIVIYRVEDGKIAEHWQQADLWTLMQLLQAGPDVTKQQLIEKKARRGATK